METELIPSKGGILEVTVNGSVVWTNRETRVKDAPHDVVIAAIREKTA
ncbi:MAG: Rdx family protein [Fimbriimonadaceae bacterium]|nr:Rdx family protein [Fimbriimonadaceae bacterium]